MKNKLVTAATQCKPPKVSSKSGHKGNHRRSSTSSGSHSDSSTSQTTLDSNQRSVSVTTNNEDDSKSGRNIFKKDQNERKKIRNNRSAKKIIKTTVNKPIKKISKAIMKKPVKKNQGLTNYIPENKLKLVPYHGVSNGEKKTESVEKRYKKSFVHFGNYLMPTFASSMKRSPKVYTPSVLTHLPFVTGQSTGKSHNLLMKLQQNKLLITKRNSRNRGDQNCLNMNFNLYNMFGGDISRFGASNIGATNSTKKYKLTVKYSNRFSKSTSNAIDYTPPSNDLFLNKRGENKNLLVKNVLSTLYQNFTAKLAQHEELENILKSKSGNKPQTIAAFKDLCDKIEDEENVIRAILFLINNVFSLNKKLQNWRMLEQQNNPRNKQLVLKRSKFTHNNSLVSNHAGSRRRRKGRRIGGGQVKETLISDQMNMNCVVQNID